MTNLALIDDRYSLLRAMESQNKIEKIASTEIVIIFFFINKYKNRLLKSNN